MNTWTDSAKSRLEDHLARLRVAAQASGADPVEVADDIRRHVDEEVVASKLEVVTTDDVSRILTRLGPVEMPGERPEPPRRTTDPHPPRPAESKRLRSFAFFFGVALPLITLGIELATHQCAAAFFDPIPDIWHVLLVASVPIINGLSWWAARYGRETWRTALGWGNAFALGVSLYYALLFATLMPIAVFAILFFGWGLLPLTPLLSFAATCRFRALLRRLNPAEEPQRLPGLGGGLTAGLAALLVFVVPIAATRHWSQIAANGSTDERHTAVKRLRAFGHRHTLLADCYGGGNWSRQSPWGFQIQGRPVAVEVARDLYYRVTGQPFNSVPPPQSQFSSRTWDFLDEFAWDQEQGGIAVGGRLKGLSLAQSRMDALVNADAAWSYTEWTLEFKNVATLAREARAQIALPAGGVVSRLTLWVNGEEREAAFAGCGEVRAAYQQVVRVQRRDPVLVTSCGPDRVLMQCFPVPADGGTIKVRLGITAPLHLEAADSAVARWPHFIERNFSLPENFDHNLWVESLQSLQSSAGLKPDQTKPGVFALHGQLRDAALGDAKSLLRLRRAPEATVAWSSDPRQEGQIVRQTIKPRTDAAPARVVFVIDGAKGMSDFLPSLAGAIEKLPTGLEIAVLLAKDGVEEIAAPARTTDASFLQGVAKKLREAECAGGQDNFEAIVRGWDIAAEKAGSVVLWIHGPQPLLFEQGESLKQRLFWRSGAAAAPRILELQTSPGPNRLVEKIEALSHVRSIPRAGTPGDDLLKLFATWRGEAKSFEFVRERSAAQPTANQTKGSSKHLVRLWAFNEILRLLGANQRRAAVELAGLYQLVTPVSGAVVLETKAQFEAAGLQPVDPLTVPSVPEPGTLLLLATALGALFVRRCVQRRHAAQSRG